MAKAKRQSYIVLELTAGEAAELERFLRYEKWPQEEESGGILNAIWGALDQPGEEYTA